ncbi:tripartite tricarboxylate transporter substrate binding protein [Pseudooceanicola pacificus]|nr:tripartite tricarboxylate transporter substrate binding protein [Pseudooceanicola pacificus]
MTHQRSKFRMACAAAAILAGSAVSAADCPEGFPGKTVNFWVGYGAGGGTDLISRTLASIIEEKEGWTISVANKPGAGSSVMMTQLAASPPDGLTVGITSTGAVSKVPNRNPDSPYSIGDFTYLGTAQLTPVSVTTLTDKPFDNYEEMIAYAKKNGSMTISTATSDANIFFDEISEREGVRIILVPNKGTAESLQQILGGHVDAALLGSGHVQHLKSGKMIQIFTMGDRPAPFAPDAPSSKDLGYDFIGAVSYVLVAAPDGLEPAVQTCLEQVLDEAVNSEEFAKVQATYDQQALNLGAKETTALLEREFAKFKDYYNTEK